MTARHLLILASLCVMPAFAADITGKWTASIDTPIGLQNYVYDFKADGGKLTGTAKNSMGEAATPITEGKISGDTVTFVEVLKLEGNEIKITYTGKIAGDEIKFARQVAEFANEEFVAKRAK
ncbi:MAG: hypothetical protein IPP47_03305 [Bryobacterales bacterium]|mgnify:CR=1 FL=1|nr:hypothetical protein [Bryobacterales bacterium]